MIYVRICDSTDDNHLVLQSKTSQIVPEFTVELKGASVGWASKDKSSKKNVLEVHLLSSPLTPTFILVTVVTTHLLLSVGAAENPSGLRVFDAV